MAARKMKVALAAVVMMAGLVAVAAPSGSTQLLTAQGTGRALVTPSNLTVTLSEVDGVANRPINNTSMAQPWYGITPFPNTQWVPDIQAEAPYAWNMTTWDSKYDANEIADCPLTAGRQVEMRCHKGSITFTFSRPVTDPVISINNIGANASSDDAEWTNQRLRKHGWGIWTLDEANSNFTGTPGMSLLASEGDIAVVSDGSNYHLPGSSSQLDGAPAITRASDPTNWLTFYTQAVGAFGSGSVKLSGTWTSVTFNRDLLWIYDTANAIHNPTPGLSFPYQAQNECILDQLPVVAPAVVHDCVLQGATWTPTGPDITSNVVGGVTNINPMPEGTTWTITFEEDFGNAPASFDATDGASHLISDLHIGSASSAQGSESALTPGTPSNNSGASGIVSPNASSTDPGSDAFVTAPEIPLSGNFDVVVPIGGASAAGRVCGYLDIDGDGTFGSTSPERQCASFLAGDTSVTLSWPRADVAAMTGSTWMRLRASYDSTGVQSPLGRLDSGEVEDWQVSVAELPATTTTTSTTIDPSTTTTTIDSQGSTTTLPGGPVETTVPVGDPVTPQFTG